MLKKSCATVGFFLASEFSFGPKEDFARQMNGWTDGQTTGFRELDKYFLFSYEHLFTALNYSLINENYYLRRKFLIKRVVIDCYISTFISINFKEK